MTAIESVEFKSDIFASSVGIFNIVASEHMEKMKNYALAGYSEHCYNEIDMSDSKGSGRPECRQHQVSNSTFVIFQMVTK